MTRSLLIYGYYLFAALSSLGSTVFVYYAVLELVGRPCGGLFSSTIFVMHSIILIVVAPLTARRIDRIDLPNRLRRSLWLQLVLIGLSLLPGFFPPLTVARYPLFFVCMGALAIAGVLSVQLGLAFPLELDRHGAIPMMRSGALSTLASRAMYMVSPLIAHALPKGQWLTAALFNSITYLGGIVACLIALHLLKDFAPSSSVSRTDTGGVLHDSVPATMQQALARWSYSFFFLINLSLGSVAFLVIGLGKERTTISALPPLTALYSGMVIALLVVMVLPRPWLERGTLTLRTTTMLFYGQCILLIFVGERFLGAVNSWLWTFGFLYGLTLLSLSEVLTKRLQGSTFVQYIGNGQASGRVGSVIATVAVGALLDVQWSPWMLLTMLGVCGFVSAVLLHYYGWRVRVLRWAPAIRLPEFRM